MQGGVDDEGEAVAAAATGKVIDAVIYVAAVSFVGAVIFDAARIHVD